MARLGVWDPVLLQAKLLKTGLDLHMVVISFSPLVSHSQATEMGSDASIFLCSHFKSRGSCWPQKHVHGKPAHKFLLSGLSWIMQLGITNRHPSNSYWLPQEQIRFLYILLSCKIFFLRCTDHWSSDLRFQIYGWDWLMSGLLLINPKYEGLGLLALCVPVVPCAAAFVPCEPSYLH